MPMRFRDGTPLTLLVDADDTLWDNNIYFLEAFDAFVDAVASLGLHIDRPRIKAVVEDAELDLINSHGYGREPYVIALRRAVVKIAPAQYQESLLARIEQIGRTLIDRHCKLLPGVEETVPELAARNRLILFTKGNRDEQMSKLDRSGLAPFFGRVETPREKDVAAYRRLLFDAHLDPERTFMIGNSPRSDVNPALRAGLRGAVYIPHPSTWELEQEEIDRTDARFIELSAFRGLTELF